MKHFLLFIVCLTACTTTSVDESYISSIKEWDIQREKDLKSVGSWLSLAGLEWMEEEGIYTFGSDDKNDMVFPKQAPTVIGKFIVTADSVTIEVANDITVKEGDNKVSKMRLLEDLTGTPTILQQGNLYWKILKRGKTFGVRIWDAENPAIESLKPIERYEIQEKWSLSANYHPYDSSKLVEFENVVGMKLKEPMIGTVDFEYEGKKEELEVMDGGKGKLFVIFADETTGTATYGGGRYLYIDKPLSGSQTTIDFNKAHNPPCAFTKYATCLLPPSQNYLSIAVESGEKNYQDH